MQNRERLLAMEIDSKDSESLAKNMRVATMLKDAMRVYKCLTPKAGLKSTFYYRGALRSAHNITNGFRAERKIDQYNRAYYVMSNSSNESDIAFGSDSASIVGRRYYLVNFNDMKDAVSVFGSPMIANFDFNSILDFANPDRKIT